jgi:SAM-dependent methyltransferase
MKFSIITPTHNPKHITELGNSILAQTHHDWEWIILLNNGITEDDLAIPFKGQDNRVKIYTDTSGNTRIGYLKNLAFYKGTGDVLVEADHDDILMPNCLEELARVYSSDKTIGFVSSNDAILPDGSEFIPYDSKYGWEFDQFHWNGQKLWVPKTFPISSHSLSFIWYAPDHVRSWKTDVYRGIGGHNHNLPFLDDQELMIRTYMHTKMHHIDKVLYIYRKTGNNTYLKDGINQQIQTETIKMGHNWMQKLAERQTELEGLMKVDLGGGIDPLAGYTVLDQYGGHITCDLNNHFPLEDNSVGVINASHVLEHLKDPIHSMKEIQRVLKHGGWAFIQVPSTDGRGAFQDPSHISFFNENSFFYYTKHDQARYIRKPVRFQSYRLDTGFPNQWWKDNHIPVVFANLVSIKEQTPRFPGLLEI